MSKRRNYTQEFKVEAVELVKNEGRSIGEAAQNLGINSTVLRRWVKDFERDGMDSFPGKGRLLPEAEKLRQLERENRRLRMERDILKKAIAFFAEVPK